MEWKLGWVFFFFFGTAVLHCGREGNMSFPFKWSLRYNVSGCGWQIGASQSQHPFSCSTLPLFTLCYNDPTGDFPSSSLAVTVRRPSPTKHQILPPLLLLLLLQLREIKFNAWLPTSLAYPNWDPKPILTHSMDFFFHSAAVLFDRFRQGRHGAVCSFSNSEASLWYWSVACQT
jgi:hypothetical protein